MENEKTKTEEFIEKYWAPITVGIIAAAGYAVGYKLGAKNEAAKISRGIEALWATNPGLEEKMWDAVAKTKMIMF